MSIRCVPAVSSMIERRLHQSGQARICSLRRSSCVQVSGAEFWLSTRGGGAEHAGQQRLLRHFEREHRHRLLICAFVATCCAMFSASAVLPIDGPRRQDEQFAAVQPAGHFIELGEAGADAL